jgi:arylsulfatase A-like enzyme
VFHPLDLAGVKISPTATMVETSYLPWRATATGPGIHGRWLPVEEEPQPNGRRLISRARSSTIRAWSVRLVVVRDKRWTYVERLYERPELYDRDNDPNERVNLADRTEHADVQARLRQALIRWLQETADVIPYQEDPRLPHVDLPPPGARTSAPTQS